jgi:nicotinate-nucleotide--dimethylbenzimidazole phosphoribosyltransferase
VTESETALSGLIQRIVPPDDAVSSQTQELLDQKTKPRGSLGRIEALACQLAGICGAVPEKLVPAVVVAAGDHGVAREGVSAYPQEVTWQMVANFVSGGAAVNVLARQVGASLVVVDAGVAAPIADPAVRSVRIGPGTQSFVDGPAMSRKDAIGALLAGADLTSELAAAETNTVAIGEMGIANTTSASAIAAAILSVEPSRVCGRGTGLDDAGVEHKAEIVKRGLDRNRVDPTDGVGVLAAVGGFEIAFLAGVILGAAAERIPVVLDGFITSASALTAAAIAPAVGGSLIASHVSSEPGHALVLERLNLKPLFDLDLRLGEGSGAALALPILASSIAICNEMATFAEAQVTDAGR